MVAMRVILRNNKVKAFLKMVWAAVFLLMGTTAWSQTARLSVFVNIERFMGIRARLEIKELRVLTAKGEEPLPLVKAKISTQETFSQVLLASGSVPAGRFRGVKLVLKEAWIRGKTFTFSRKSLDIFKPFSIRKGESRSLFLVWNVVDSIEGESFWPRMYLKKLEKPLPGENLFVDTEDTGTIWVVTPDLNQVVYSFAVCAQPRSMVVGTRENSFYVLCRQERTLKVVGANSFQVEEVIPIPLATDPSFMASGENGLALISSPRDRLLVLMDLSQGSIVHFRRMDFEPEEVAYLPSINKFVISAPRNNAVYIVDQYLKEIRLASGFRPRGFSVDDEYLYVADEAGGVHFYRLENFQYAGRVETCRHPVRALVAGERIFVSCEEGHLAVFLPGHRTVSRWIRTGRGAFSLILHSQRRWLYIALQEEKALGVLDFFREKFIGKIYLGGRPFEMVVTH